MAKGIFIILFRGINVGAGGGRTVKMETLRKALTDAGFEDVATYIQSGNVVLTSDRSEKATLELVDETFTRTFGFSSRATIRSLHQLQMVIDDNPYASAMTEGRQLHAIFIDEAPAKDAISKLEALANTEQMELRDGVLYLFTPDGFGRSKVAEALDKVLKVPLTARNWNTVLKLHEMAQKATEG
jgi:uncharacterized protein (DUF1697 family)